MTETLFRLFPTDKIEHGYLPAYIRLADMIGPHGNVCEIGVHTGGSLELWRVLFPHGITVGVDNNPACTWPPYTEQVISSQDDPKLPNRLASICADYDLIVDDASHIGALTAETHRLLWPLVKPGGFYVIEDWMISLWGWDDGSMLRTVQSLLLGLTSPTAEIASITYQYGMAIVRKRP